MTYKQSLNIQNFQLGKFDGQGKFDIPIIEKTDRFGVVFDNLTFAGFGERCSNPEEHGCHFFLDDYRIQRVWNSPLRYVDMLQKYKVVLAPDFSMFVDYPKALSLYNHYRKHWCAKFWQENGVTVIPTINWMYEDSYDWCFDGEPSESIVAVSSNGVNNSKAMIDMFRKGYDEMERRLNPSLVLFFGKYCLPQPRDNVIMCRTTFQNRIEMLRKDHAKGCK